MKKETLVSFPCLTKPGQPYAFRASDSKKKKGLVSVVLVPGHTSIPREAYGKIKMKQQSWAWRVATHPEVQIPLVGVEGVGSPISIF